MSSSAVPSAKERVAHPIKLPPGRPSLFVRRVLAPMTKTFNPIVRRLAGKRRLAFAGQIHHFGRRSGRVYVTPASTRPTGHGFVVPLTFGPWSDWCRNVLASDGCGIRYRGIYYSASGATVIERRGAPSSVVAAFKRRERAVFGLLGIKYFLLLAHAEQTPQPAVTGKG
jgi:hypothetical protein